MKLSTCLIGLVACLRTTSVVAWNIPSTDIARPINRRQLLVAGVAATFLPTVAQARNMPESTGVAAGQATGSLEALERIVQMRKGIALLKLQAKQSLVDIVKAKSLSTTTSVPLTEKDFKAIFDAYSDPVSYKQKFVDQNAFLVYYTKGFDGPGRPSIESDLPTKQPSQYGARNEAWIAWEEFVSELDFVRRNPEDLDSDLLVNLLTRVESALDLYLQEVPSDDLAAVERNLSNQ